MTERRLPVGLRRGRDKSGVSVGDFGFTIRCPFIVSEALGPDPDGHPEGREGVGQRDGAVKSRWRKGQAALHLLGEADLPSKEMKLTRPPKGAMALVVASRSSLAALKREVISGRVV